MTTSLWLAEVVSRFVIVTIPSGERPPTITFTSGNDTGPHIELTPTIDQQWPAINSACVHEIRSGDYPASVAEAFGITIDGLAEANTGNPAWSTWTVGEHINVPAPCQTIRD